MHRYYDPNTGRYITSDLIGLQGGLNAYGYAGQNLIRYADPFGLYTLGDAENSLVEQGVAPGDVGLLWDSYTDTQIFDEWLRLELSDQDWLEELTPCPPTVDMCTLGEWHEPNTDVSQDFHPGGAFEVRSRTTPGNHSNQCIYDENGDLMTEIPAAGTADFRPCPNPPFCLGHYNHDVKPFLLSPVSSNKCNLITQQAN